MGLFGLGKKKAPAAMTHDEAAALEEKAVELYRAGEYKKAFPLFQQAAEYGLSSSQFNCGLMCEKGRGTVQDYKQALRWYMKAVKQEDETAQYNAAVLIEQGKGGPELTMEHALPLYKMAAENGVLQAQMRCGAWYARNEDDEESFEEPGPEDMKEALKWYEMAAKQGNVLAQVKCAHCYQHGNGTVPNPARALMWFEKAAEQGDRYAQGVCADWYYRGVGTEKNMEKAVMWRDKAMSQQ